MLWAVAQVKNKWFDIKVKAREKCKLVDYRSLCQHKIKDWFIRKTSNSVHYKI
jgi:hypothetical protein